MVPKQNKDISYTDCEQQFLKIQHNIFTVFYGKLNVKLI